MLRLAIGYVRSREEAEEVIQETWLAVLTGLERFEGRSSLKTWITRILVNRARSRARRESRMVPLSTLGPIDPGGGVGDIVDQLDWLRLTRPSLTAAWGLGSTPPAPDDRVLGLELLDRIETAIDSLPPRQREVITLRDVEGWSATEVRELLEITEANQRVLLHRARLKVRDALVPYVAEVM
jgi:RNA polymerase sigma-70 factor (ECF subfamily)